MGFDRLSNFIIKNLNYTNNFIIDEIKRSVLCNHLLFDLNFVIFNQMFLLEQEINNIIKIVLNLPFSYCKDNKTESKLNDIFGLPWWDKYCENIEYIFDGNTEDEIIDKLISFLTIKHENNLNKLDLMLIDKIIFYVENIISDYHDINYIQTIGFFIDGIPSFSKILEQRRRRCKNYFESTTRKSKFDDYFGKITNSYVEEDGIKYNYFKWINERFNYDKSLSPISPVIKKLEYELNKYFSKKYNKINIVVNPGSINGESDIKIFSHIHKNKLEGDIVIHTTDSDLIHLILLQQTYFNLNRKDVHLSILRHNTREIDTIQYFDSTMMIQSLLKHYNDINNNNSSDYRIIYDLCFIMLFFGNDHLPSSFELGPEIGLEQILKLCGRLKEPIINLVNNKIELNFNNFKLFLMECNKYQKNFYTKIMITRHFKMLPNITNILTDYDKLNLNFDEIKELIKMILINDGLKVKDKLDNDDIRKKLIESINIETFDFNNYLGKFKEHLRNQLLNIMDNLIECLDLTSEENNGLISYTKPYLKTKDNYQDLYNILSENTITELNIKNKVLYEPLKDDYLTYNEMSYSYDKCFQYIKKIYHITTSFFGNLENYHTNNITAYSYNEIPKIEHLIKYLNENNDINKIISEIASENLNQQEYFNSVNHHIFITAYLQIEDIKDENIKNTTKLLNVNNLWIGNQKIEEFNHNQVKPLDFLNDWSNGISQQETEIPMILNPKEYNFI